MPTKELLFKMASDDGSFAKLSGHFKTLLSDMEKLVKLSAQLANTGLPGMASIGNKSGVSQQAANAITKTPPMGRPLVQNVVDHRSLFNGLATGSKDSMRMMTDSLKMAVGMQKKELKDLDNEAKHLIATYEKLNKLEAAEARGARPSSGRDYAGERRGIASDFVTNQGERAAGMKTAAELEQLGAGGAGSKGGVLSRLPSLGPGGAALGRFGAAALVLGAAKWGIDQTVGEATGFSGQTMNRVRSVEPMFNRMMSGDMKIAYAMTQMSKGSQSAMFGLAGGDNSATSLAAGAQTWMGAAGQMVGSIPIVGGLARKLGLVGGDKGEGMIGGFSGLSRQTQLAEKGLQEAEQQVASLSPMTKYAIDKFSGELAQRVSVGRVLGTGMSRDKVSRDPARGDTWTDSHSALAVSLQAQGYDPGQYAGAFAGLRGQAGASFARKHAYSAMAAQAAGFSGWDTLLGAGGRSGSGMAFAQGSIGGGIDAQAGLMLGQTIIGSGFDPRGTTTGLGLLAAAQNGMQWTGKESDFNQANRVGAGIGLLDKISTGVMDPYQQGRNLVDAMNRNPTGSIYSQDFLANGMNIRQMIDMGFGNSPLSASANSLLTGTELEKRNMIRGSAVDKVSSIMDRWTDTGGTDSMSKTMRKYRAGGGDLEMFLKKASIEEQKDMGVFFGAESGEGEEAGLGAVGLISGMGGKLKSKKGLGGGQGEMEKKANEALSRNLDQVKTTLENSAATLFDSLGKAPEKIMGLEKFGAQWNTSAASLVTALGDLTEAITGKKKKERRERLKGADQSGWDLLDDLQEQSVESK